MAITTLDGVIAGMKAPVPIIKAGVTMAAAGAMRGYTPWYVAGNPGASTATSIGINGEAATPALASTGGRLPRTNPGSGNAYLARLAIQTSVIGTLWLIDRVWQNSGLSVTSTGAQAITPATLPARSGDGTTNGANIMAAIEWSAAGSRHSDRYPDLHGSGRQHGGYWHVHRSGIAAAWDFRDFHLGSR